jgi:hypothetical protein
MKTKILILVLVFSLSLIVIGSALADGCIELPRWVLGSGVSDSAGGGATLRATLGQPVVGVVSNGDIALGQGFWIGSSGRYPIYLPLVQR